VSLCLETVSRCRDVKILLWQYVNTLRLEQLSIVIQIYEMYDLDVSELYRLG
jgi:hypothetical protein